MTITRDALRRTAAKFHRQCQDDGDLSHLGEFPECPEQRCATMRAYLESHVFAVAPPPFVCEQCSGSWIDLNDALDVKCEAAG